MNLFSSFNSESYVINKFNIFYQSQEDLYLSYFKYHSSLNFQISELEPLRGKGIYTYKPADELTNKLNSIF